MTLEHYNTSAICNVEPSHTDVVLFCVDVAFFLQIVPFDLSFLRASPLTHK